MRDNYVLIIKTNQIFNAMNFTILIIGLIAIVAFVVPMVIINNHGKALIEKKKKQLEDLATSNNLIINYYQIYKTMILAIDKENKKLVHIANNKESIIDLFSATNVKIDKTYIKDSKVIDNITLSLNTKNGVFSIPFYSPELKNVLDLQEQSSSSTEWLHKIEECTLKPKESQSSVA